MGRKPCCSKNDVKKGAWMASEDKILTEYIAARGEGKWRDIPKLSGLQRCGKSCRLRWLNYLRPDIKRGNISADEEDLIIRLHRLLGNRWSLIAGRLPGRTDNEIKNYWNTHLAKKPQPSPNNLSPPARDSTLSNSAETTMFSCPSTVPSSMVRSCDMNVLKSNHVETCSAKVPWSSEDNYHQDLSFFSLDFEMGDISVSGGDFDKFFSSFNEVHTEDSIGNESLQNLTDSLENWSASHMDNDGFESSASLIGSAAAAAGSAIEDWLGSIIY
ncbi:unnamed protein product [Rhodiola kirilowii]